MKGVALAVLLATAAVASHGRELTGEITSINQSTKSFVLKAGARDLTIYWTGATKVTGGSLKTGERVVIRSMDKEGKTWATSVKVTENSTKRSK